MKKLIFTYFLLLPLLISAQSLERQYNYAEKLFTDELYFHSITEYKRLLFFDEEGKYSFDANFKIGLAYKRGVYFDNAIEYFSAAERNTQKDEEKLKAKFQIIRCNILRKTTDRALELLGELKNQNELYVPSDSINYWTGWAYMFADKWNKAAESFSLISQNNELKLIAERVNDQKYSVTFARVISYILPGAGQFYTGNYFSGIMSLAWNSLFGYLTINSFIEERAFDGIMTGSLLWLRFYRGNIQNAGKLARLENIKTANQTLRYLQNNFRGVKP